MGAVKQITKSVPSICPVGSCPPPPCVGVKTERVFQEVDEAVPVKIAADRSIAAVCDGSEELLPPDFNGGQGRRKGVALHRCHDLWQDFQKTQVQLACNAQAFCGANSRLRRHDRHNLEEQFVGRGGRRQCDDDRFNFTRGVDRLSVVGALDQSSPSFEGQCAGTTHRI
jgi:hypothetical protein